MSPADRASLRSLCGAPLSPAVSREIGRMRAMGEDSLILASDYAAIQEGREYADHAWAARKQAECHDTARSCYAKAARLLRYATGGCLVSITYSEVRDLRNARAEGAWALGAARFTASMSGLGDTYRAESVRRSLTRARDCYAKAARILLRSTTIALCADCLCGIGGACGGPDGTYRMALPGESCGAADCQNLPS